MIIPMANSIREKLDQLMIAREALEESIKACGTVLATNNNVGMDGPLIDDDGYPRNDIDVHSVREARQKIIRFQNDHKKMMKEIENLLHQLHSLYAMEQTSLVELNLNDVNPTLNEHDDPIVKVNLVSDGSPAAAAGLEPGDYIMSFGSVNCRNFENNLNQIASVARHAENQRVSVKVKRGNEILNLVIVPRQWLGRGLLGCGIVLIDSTEG